jgi:putative ABC transport system substrate-binding protein
VAILWDPDFPAPRLHFSEYPAAAKTLRVDIQSLEVKALMPLLESAFQAAHSNRARALIIITNPFVGKLRKSIMALAARDGLPVVAENSGYVRDGALLSYAADVADEAKTQARIVAKILKGASPGDLPIEQPTTFELVLNMKTAKALGLTIPPAIMVQATRVIQ